MRNQSLILDGFNSAISSYGATANDTHKVCEAVS
jgi:hypothetical protein